MTASRLLAVAASAALLVLLATGCGAGRPSDAELRAASDQARATVISLSDGLVEAVQDGNPDLTFVREAEPMGPAHSWDCSDSPAATGEAIQWAADRMLDVQPTQPVDKLLDPLIDDLSADGWQVTSDESEEQRLVRLDRDGYMIKLAADNQVSGDHPTFVRVGSYSPCLVAPGP